MLLCTYWTSVIYYFRLLRLLQLTPVTMLISWIAFAWSAHLAMIKLNCLHYQIFKSLSLQIITFTRYEVMLFKKILMQINEMPRNLSSHDRLHHRCYTVQCFLQLVLRRAWLVLFSNSEYLSNFINFSRYIDLWANICYFQVAITRFILRKFCHRKKVRRVI